MRRTLDTIESLVETERQETTFAYYASKFLRQFQYTKPAKMRGLDGATLGIIESQHRKITYRMKHRGMYWSRKGGLTMAQMILLAHKDELRDLFFGSWREDYQKYQSLEKLTVERVTRPARVDRTKDYNLPTFNENFDWRMGGKKK
ncbi:hypothetical protein STRDD10_00401 [Streptococcus sp. DD10]|nr:hypothetical protein STRDD10_00401 [Streptococcus sp. DD10]